jgi:hypothetical protein
MGHKHFAIGFANSSYHGYKQMTKDKFDSDTFIYYYILNGLLFLENYPFSNCFLTVEKHYLKLTSNGSYIACHNDNNQKIYIDIHNIRSATLAVSIIKPHNVYMRSDIMAIFVADA